MAYIQNNYIPPTFEELLSIVVSQWNAEFGTDYDVKTFEGTNAYRFAYVFIQTQIQQQTAISEIYTKLQDYFDDINAIIKIPATTNSGLVDEFKARGYQASIRNNTIEQAGTIAVAVDVDTEAEDYPPKKTEILTILKDFTIAGLYFDGGEEGEVLLSNGQAKRFAFSRAERTETALRLTITYNRGSSYAREQEAQVKEKLLKNLENLYGLGNDFAPEKYYQIDRDAPYAAFIKLEYKNGKTQNQWQETIYTADFTDLFIFDAETIEVYFNE